MMLPARRTKVGSTTRREEPEPKKEEVLKPRRRITQEGDDNEGSEAPQVKTKKAAHSVTFLQYQKLYEGEERDDLYVEGNPGYYQIQHKRMLIRVSEDGKINSKIRIMPKGITSEIAVFLIGLSSFSNKSSSPIGIQFADPALPPNIHVLQPDRAEAEGFSFVMLEDTSCVNLNQVIYRASRPTKDRLFNGIDLFEEDVEVGVLGDKKAGAFLLPVGLGEDKRPLCPVGYLTYLTKSRKNEDIELVEYRAGGAIAANQKQLEEYSKRYLKLTKTPYLVIDPMKWRPIVSDLSGGPPRPFQASFELDIYYLHVGEASATGQ